MHKISRVLQVAQLSIVHLLIGVILLKMDKIM